MDDTYVLAAFRISSFHCPHCKTYALQHWYTRTQGIDPMEPYTVTWSGSRYTLDNLSASLCSKCGKYCLWLEGKLLYPNSSIAPFPEKNMPEDVKSDFLEARDIVNASPRGAAALLRLALQKLMLHLGENGKDLNEDIGNLVKKGLPERIQKAPDVIRVLGNNAVHPGRIDLKDDIDTALILFVLLNMIVDLMITQPKKIEELYGKIPTSTQNAIAKRDSKT